MFPYYQYPAIITETKPPKSGNILAVCARRYALGSKVAKIYADEKRRQTTIAIRITPTKNAIIKLRSVY